MSPKTATAPGRGKARAKYEGAKAIAHDGSTRARRRLAQRDDTQPEILYYLAEDSSPEVRRAVAANTRTPAHADLVLARDTDDEVRYSLVEKIAELAPGLSHHERGHVLDLILEVIEVLARDQLPRVRGILSEALAEVTGEPPETIRKVVKRLAWDEFLEVAAPVLERSVLLSDEDLLEIIESHPLEGALAAIARRAEVSPAVSDAIAAGDDRDAVAALLGNKSAQIREETLDRIIDRAPGVEAWHRPLVGRPKLSANAVQRIAGFIAESLLDLLRRRDDLDAQTAKAVEAAVRRRLAGPSPAKPEQEAAGKKADNARTRGDKGTREKKAKTDRKTGKDDKEKRKPEKTEKKNRNAAKRDRAKAEKKAKSNADTPLARAKRLHAKGELTEEVVSRAVGSGDRALASAALAVLADLSPEVVGGIIASRSPKAVTALAWKAGLGMRLAMQMQLRLAHVPPNGVLHARDGVDFPLSAEDMMWQIEFYGG